MQRNIVTKNNNNMKSNYSNKIISNYSCITSTNSIKESKNTKNRKNLKTNSNINKIELRQFILNKAYFSPKAKTNRKNRLFLNSQKSEKKIEIHLSDNKYNNIIKETKNKNNSLEKIKHIKNKLEIEINKNQKRLKRNKEDKNNMNINSCQMNNKSKFSDLLKEESIKELDIEENEENNTPINNNIFSNIKNFNIYTINNNTYESENLYDINKNKKIINLSIILDSNIENKNQNHTINNNYKNDIPHINKKDSDQNEINLDLLKYSKKGDKEKLLELISNPKININYTNNQGWTALHFACDEGNLKIVEILINSNINLNYQNIEKKTPLHISSLHGYFDITKLLVENGADLNIEDNDKNLAIHLCSLNGHSELLAYLLNKNIKNIYKKNKFGKTIDDLAKNIETKLIVNEYKKKIKNEKNQNLLMNKSKYKKTNNKKNVSNNNSKYNYSKIVIHKTNLNQIKNLITPIHNFKDYSIKNKKNNYINRKSTNIKNGNKNIIFNYKNTDTKNNLNNNLNESNNDKANNSTSSLFGKNEKPYSCFNISINTYKSNNKKNNNSNLGINNSINNYISNTSIKKKKYIFSKNNKKSDIHDLYINKINNISSHIKTKTNNIYNSNKNLIYNIPANTCKTNELIINRTTIGEKSKKNNSNIKSFKNDYLNYRQTKKIINKNSPDKIYLTKTNIKNHNKRRIILHKKIKSLFENGKYLHIKNSKRTISSPSFPISSNSINNSKIKERIKNNKRARTSIKKINKNKSNISRSNNKLKIKNILQKTYSNKNNNIINISNEDNNKNNLALDKINTDDEEDNLIDDLDEEEEVIANLKEFKEKKKLKILEYKNNENNNNKIIKEKLNKQKMIKNNTKFKKNKNHENNNRNKNNLNNKDINFYTKKNKNNSNYKYNNINLNNNNNNSNIKNNNDNNINTNHKDSNINNPTTSNTNVNNNKDDQDSIPNDHINNNINKKIGPEDFICLGILGHGSFGEVFLVNKKNTEKYFAMKVLDKRKIAQQNIFKYAMTERNVLSVLNFPFIVKLNYAFQTNQKLFLLLDFAPGGDLSTQLRFRKRFREEVAKFYICEIALAIGELHKHDIIFRDLKPDNIIIDKDGHILLTDFGLSRSGITDREEANSFCGSVAYLAPEMLNRKGHGKAVDWYLLGVVFFEMLVGVPPYFSYSQEQIFNNIDKAELILPNFISKKAQELIKALLVKNPDERLGSKDDIEEIKNHEYFKDVDWDKVYSKEYLPPPIIGDINKFQFLKYPQYYMDNNVYDSGDDYFNNQFNIYNYKNEKENVYVNDNFYEGWSFIKNCN